MTPLRRRMTEDMQVLVTAQVLNSTVPDKRAPAAGVLARRQTRVTISVDMTLAD